MRVFLEKILGLDGQGLFFSRKAWVWMSGAHFSREKAGFGWLGRVFLEKSVGLDERGAFSREKPGSGWLGRVFLERSLGLDGRGANS